MRVRYRIAGIPLDFPMVEISVAEMDAIMDGREKASIVGVPLVFCPAGLVVRVWPIPDDPARYEYVVEKADV